MGCQRSTHQLLRRQNARGGCARRPRARDEICGKIRGAATATVNRLAATRLAAAIEGTGRIGYNETSDGHAPGRLAQLVRALASHARGQRFKSSIAHHSRPIRRLLDGIKPKWRNGRRAAFRAQCPLRAWEFKSPLRHHNFLLAHPHLYGREMRVS